MAKATSSKKKKAPARKKAAAKPRFRPMAWIGRAVGSFLLAIVVWVGAYAVIPPPTTPYILSEAIEQNGITRRWVSADEIAPVMLRAVVAAEDANFCLHWGIDMRAVRASIDEGGNRGASTLSQQTVKNVFLWHGRSWPRKALEALITPVVEAIWSKRRVLEIYLNVAEFDAGVFGIEAAAQHHFGVSALELSTRQATLLAAVLPNPKERQAVNPSESTQRRARAIADGAATIRVDGRSGCFE